jgi:hypothetical protein
MGIDATRTGGMQEVIFNDKQMAHIEDRSVSNPFTSFVAMDCAPAPQQPLI